MRNIFILFSFVISLSSFACGIGGANGGSNLPWDEIRRCSALTFDTPRITIDKESYSIFELCQTEGAIRTAMPVKINCNDYDIDNDGDTNNTNCIGVYKYLPKEQRISKKCEPYQKDECIDGEEIVIKNQTSFEIQVYEVSIDKIGSLLFQKSYTLNKCPL